MEKILKKAFVMFSDWVTNAKIVYPNLNYDITNPNILEKDLEESLNSAIQALKQEEKKKKRKQAGFDFGYICGFLAGNLNSHWYSEYIRKQRNDYKMYAAIVALDSFLKFDDLLKIKLTDLYKEHYQNGVNLDNINTDIILQMPTKLDFLEPEQPKNAILATLENIRIQMIKKVFEEKIPDFLIDTSQYFSKEDIDKIINQEQKIFIFAFMIIYTTNGKDFGTQKPFNYICVPHVEHGNNVQRYFLKYFPFTMAFL